MTYEGMTAQNPLMIVAFAIIVILILGIVFGIAVKFFARALRPEVEQYRDNEERREKEYQEYREGYKREHGYYPPEEKSLGGGDFATGFIIGSLWH